MTYQEVPTREDMQKESQLISKELDKMGNPRSAVVEIIRDCFNKGYEKGKREERIRIGAELNN